jgi:Abortive infection alpha
MTTATDKLSPPGTGSSNGHRPEPDYRLDVAAIIAATPGLMRIAAGAWLRTAEWTFASSLRTGNKILRAAVTGQSAADLLAQVGSEARDYVRRLLELADVMSPANDDEDRADSSTAGNGNGSGPLGPGTLRDRGAELLRRSADISYEEAAHPAYDRILGDLAPDEGRVLRFLYQEGAQPAVDVRSGKALNVSTQLVAPGLSMIAAQAGARYTERVPAYMNNLYRLGLIWFSREPLHDPLRYQVLEAQPEVLEAMRKPGRSKTVRRSIHLTPFGEDFCLTCLPVDASELDALPGDVPDA